MKTFNEFLDEILEDYKTLTQDQLDKISDIKKRQGRRKAMEYLKALQSKSIRNLPSSKQSSSIEKLNPISSLPKGYVGKWDPETKSYVRVN